MEGSISLIGLGLRIISCRGDVQALLQPIGLCLLLSEQNLKNNNTGNYGGSDGLSQLLELPTDSDSAEFVDTLVDSCLPRNPNPWVRAGAADTKTTACVKIHHMPCCVT